MPLADNEHPVLIVEDDRNTAALIATYLERDGFATRTVHDGNEALQLARQHEPLFIILDVMLPGLDGWEICRELRRNSEVPILMLTAREEEVDRLVGLSLGADDYVVKPFSPRELVQRVKTILRRTHPRPAVSGAPLHVAGVILDQARHKVTRDGRPVNLTAAEFKLLQALMSAPGRVFSRDELLDRLYTGGETVIDRVVDVHISKLRQKLESDPSMPRLIVTVRGYGYRLTEAEES
jgi:DNA-binding response OmpR family regulator